MHFAGEKYHLFSPIGVWLRMALVSEPTTTLQVAGLKRFAILASKSQIIVSLNSRIIEGSFRHEVTLLKQRVLIDIAR